MEDSSNDGSQKQPRENGNDKKSIVTCEDANKESASAKMEKRILAVETALQELGVHFVKYQEDVAGILVQECARLTQQVNEQKDRIQKRTQDQMQNALSRAREDMSTELKFEMKRLVESSSLAMTKSTDSMSRTDFTSTPGAETASTADIEELDTTAELRKLMTEMRKDINEVHSVLSVRASTTEKRLEALESGIGAQQKQVKDVTDSTPVPLSEQWTQMSRYRSASQTQGASSHSRAPSTSSVTSVERRINELLTEQSPRPKPSGSIAAEVNKAIESLAASIKTAFPVDSTAPLRGCNDTASIDGNVRKLRVTPARQDKSGMPLPHGHKSGSVQFPVKGVESDKSLKQSGSVQLRTPGRSMPRGLLERGCPAAAVSEQKITTSQPSSPCTRWSSTSRQIAVSSTRPAGSPDRNASARTASVRIASARSATLSRATSPYSGVLRAKVQSILTSSPPMTAQNVIYHAATAEHKTASI